VTAKYRAVYGLRGVGTAVAKGRSFNRQVPFRRAERLYEHRQGKLVSDIDLRRTLESSPFAAELSPEWLRRLVDAGVLRRFAPGAVLFREGDRSDAFYLVGFGHVALDMTVPARGTTRLLTVGPGEMLAWSALLGSARMTATATAVDDVEVFEFSGAVLREWCEADPSFGYRWMRQFSTALAARLLATRIQLLDLFTADAGPRDLLK
jgi:CRP-like cAMP-binding protein